ncbi:MAG: hypothetical protein MZV65_18995 [Chromatiales bacterium]|nr:hypothetical protein [Chromatiales bacterium]
MTMSLWKRFTRTRAITEGTGIDIVAAGRQAGGALPAVRRRHTSAPGSTEVEGFESTLESIRPFIDRVYFIPTNYRVYHRQLAPGTALPDAQWEYLRRPVPQALRCRARTSPGR